MTEKTEERQKKIPGETSTNRVLEAITKAAGDVLLRSKIPASRKSAIASQMTDLGATFETLAKEAWGDA